MAMTGRPPPRRASPNFGIFLEVNRIAIARAQDDGGKHGDPDMSPNDANDVIIADNDYIVRDILRSILEAEGFTVLPVADGHEAIDYAMRTNARLLILDYKMPRLDGISTCGEIRRLPGYADVPIVILTAFDDELTRMAAREAGVTAFLTKPFKPIDLLHAVRELLGIVAPEHERSEQPARVWQRRPEPQPLFGEPTRLAEGHRVLRIFRARQPSHR
jgi:CheY-like chemotaxis protein